MEEFRRRMLAQGTPPAEVAEKVYEAARDGKFYVFPNPEFKPAVLARLTNIIEEMQPTRPLHRVFFCR
jgi:hypothetical protein